MTVEDLNVTKSPLVQAREEIEKENIEKAVKLLKEKLREQNKAELILANIKREIEDLEARIEQGDV